MPPPEAPTLDMFSMRDMCRAAVPDDAPTITDIQRKVFNIQEDPVRKPLFSSRSSTARKLAPSGTLDIITNRIHLLHMAQKKASTTAVASEEDEEIVESAEGTHNFNVGHDKVDTEVEVAVDVEVEVDVDVDVEFEADVELEVEVAVDANIEAVPTPEGAVYEDSVSDETLEAGYYVVDATEVDAFMSAEITVVPDDEVAFMKVDKGKGCAVDEIKEAASDSECVQDGKRSDDDYDGISSAVTHVDPECEDDSKAHVEPANLQEATPATEHHAIATHTAAPVAASPSAPVPRKGKDKMTPQVDEAAMTAVENVWNEYLAENGADKDPRGKGEKKPTLRKDIPDPKWTRSPVEAHIESMQGYTPCPLEGCPYAFGIKRVQILMHFIQHHYNDERFEHVKHVLAWLALPKDIREKKKPKNTRFTCIFRGTSLDSKECGGFHVADGYGRHLATTHNWEGLVNFRCVKCEVEFYARDGIVSSLRSAHLKACPHSKYYKPAKTAGRSSKAPKNPNSNAKNSSTSSESSEFCKKRKGPSDSDDEHSGAGPSKRRYLRSSA